MPKPAKCLFASSYLWEIFNKAFEGMQPTFKQVPPRDPLFSMHTAFNPNYAAFIAAT